METKRNSVDLISDDLDVCGFQVDGRTVPVKVFYENRFDSRVSIGYRGVSIRIPISLSFGQRLRQINKLLSWAKERALVFGYRHYCDGDTIQVGKTSFVLNLKYELRRSVVSKLNGTEISISIPDTIKEENKFKQIRLHIGRAIAKANLSEVKYRINYLNRKHFNPVGYNSP